MDFNHKNTEEFELFLKYSEEIGQDD